MALILVISSVGRYEHYAEGVEALEQSKMNDRRLVRDGVFMFLAGGVTMLLIVLSIVALLSLYAK